MFFLYFLKLLNKFLQNSNLSCEIGVPIMMVHEFEHFSQVLVSVNLLALKSKVESKFSETGSA